MDAGLLLVAGQVSERLAPGREAFDELGAEEARLLGVGHDEAAIVADACRFVPTNNTRLPPLTTCARYFFARSSPLTVSRMSIM